MIKIYGNACNKYRKSKNFKIYIFLKTLLLSIFYSKCGHEYKKKYLNKNSQLKYYKLLVYVLIQKSIRIYIMVSEENVSQEFRNIDETRNHFIRKINQNELMSKKHKKVSRILNCIILF